MKLKIILLALCVFAGLASAQAYRAVNVTIAQGASLSAAANLGFCSVMRMELPTIDSAALTFQISEDGTTYRNYYDEFGSEVSVPASTGARIVRFNPGDLRNIRYIKIRSGTAASAVNQTTAAVSIRVVCQMITPQ
jgi:hypothetical protein